MFEPKEYFVEQMARALAINNNSKILELGCGQSRAILPILKKFPEIKYVGVEPHPQNASIAAELLKPFKNARIINNFAYEKIENETPFDICISLSVLEHVKQLKKFLINSIVSVKNGGQIIHRYDLGHALYPISYKEKIQAWLGTKLPWALPEHKFVRYLGEKEVRKILEDNGVRVEKITYHQMPNHKAFIKYFNADTEEKKMAVKQIFDWEMNVSAFLENMNAKQRELLFPTITFWGVKNSN